MCGLQVQQQPSGVLTYQQHFQRTAGAMAVPACAVLLHWLAAFWMDMQQRRDTRKLQRLQATQKTMLKELKVTLALAVSCVLAYGNPVA
jgi:choline-glycine betaine transporter